MRLTGLLRIGRGLAGPPLFVLSLAGGFVSAQATTQSDQALLLGIVANVDAPQVSVFDANRFRILAQVAIPGASRLLDTAICPLSDGRVVGAVSDFSGRVHLLDPRTQLFKQSISLTQPAAALSCCGDYLIVSSGAFIRLPQQPPPPGQLGLEDRIPLVVDLLADLEVTQQALDLPGSTSNQCGVLADTVFTTTLARDTVDRLLFDSQDGQLQTTFDSMDADDPVHVLVGAGGRCGAWVSDGDNSLTGFTVDSFSETNTVTAANGLSMLDACMGRDRIFIRSVFPDEIAAFDIDANCQIHATPSYRLDVPGPALGQFPAVNTMSCHGDLLFVAVDGGDNTPLGDAIAVFQQHSGRPVSTIQQTQLNGPQGIAVVARPPGYAIPLFNPMGLIIFMLTLLFSGCLHQAAKKP